MSWDAHRHRDAWQQGVHCYWKCHEHIGRRRATATLPCLRFQAQHAAAEGTDTAKQGTSQQAADARKNVVVSGRRKSAAGSSDSSDSSEEEKGGGGAKTAAVAPGGASKAPGKRQRGKVGRGCLSQRVLS